MSRTDKAAKGYVASIVQYALQIAVQAALAPVVLRVAGKETLGAYAAVMQIVGYLALLDIGGSWSLERFLGQAVGADDGGEHFRRIFTTQRTFALITNTAFGISLVCFGVVVGDVFTLSPGAAHAAANALSVIAVWAVLRTPMAAFNSALIATQDLAAANVIAACLGVGRAVATLVFALAGFGLFGLMLAGTIVEAVGTVFYRVRYRQKFPHLMPSWGIASGRLFREMFGFGIHALLVNVGNMLVFTSGSALAAITGGPVAASVFYTSQMPGMVCYNLVLRIADSATPAVNELWGKRDVAAVRSSFLRIMRLSLACAIPLGAGIALFNGAVVTGWVGRQQYAGDLLSVALGIACVVITVQHIAMIYAFVLGWVRLLTVTSLLQGAANIALAVWLTRLLGIGGIVVALVIALLPQCLLVLHRLCRALGTTPWEVANEVLRPLCIPSGTAIAVAICTVSIAADRPVVVLAVGGPLLVLTYGATMWLWGLRAEDRNLLRAYARRIQIPGWSRDSRASDASH